MRNKKGLVTKFILEKLAESGELALEAMFPKNTTEGRVWRKIFNLPAGYELSKQNFSAVLSRLKNQGLVERSASKKYAKWFITSKGKNRLNSYKIELVKTDGVPRLVMYDIPETQRRKRDLLRLELVACSYQQLQRSVWLGYSPLPEKFIQDLKNSDLENKVHIVSIDKKGTLTEF